MGKLIKEAYLDTDEEDNLVVVFTKAGLKKFGLKVGSEVDINIVNGTLVLTPIKKKK